MRCKLKGKKKFKIYTRLIPEIKSNDTYKEFPQILSFGDEIEEYRGGSLENSMDIPPTILLQFSIQQAKLLKLATTSQ